MNARTFIPISTEAEQACLCALMTGASFDAVQPLKASDFFTEAHAEVFAAIQRLNSKRRPVDLVTVHQSLTEQQSSEPVDLDYLQQLVDMGVNVRHAAEHARIVRTMAGRRALFEAAEKALEIAGTPGGELATLTDQAASLFTGLLRDHVSRAPRTLAEAALMRTEHLEAVERGEVEPGWRTGIEGVDRRLSGGLRAGHVYIVAARPSVGKSSLAQWIGMQHAKYGRKCLFLSQEMPEAELADRGISSAAQVDQEAMQAGSMSRDDWNRVSDAIDDPVMRNFYVDDQPALTLMDVRAKAKQVKGLRVLILDYLQLCAGSTGREANRNAEIEQISRGLKQLAKEMGIAVVALSQLNREVERRATKRPILADLRDSGSIEQDADVVMLMWTARDLGNGQRLVGLDFAKNRQGRTGEEALHFDGARQSWAQSNESLAPPPPGQGGRRTGFSQFD